MIIQHCNRMVSLMLLALILSACGGGGGSAADRTGLLPCVLDSSTWDSGCTWGS